MDTVIFDLGKVLVDFDWKAYLKRFAYDIETYHHVADAIFNNEDWIEGDRGTVINTQEWLNLFIENDPLYEKQIREVYKNLGDTISIMPYTNEWIQYFRKRQFRIYYLSNYSCELYRQTQKQLQFLKEFDGGIFSWKEKCIKPDKRIYQCLLDRYQITPEKALFFDDRQENIEAAKQMGIQGVLFKKDIPLQMMGK